MVDIVASAYLTTSEVAVSSGERAEDIRRFVELGFITPGRGGPVSSVRHHSGPTGAVTQQLGRLLLDERAEAVAVGRVTLDYVDQLIPEPVALVEPSDDGEETLCWVSDWAPILGSSSPHGLVRTDDLRLLQLMTRAVEVGIAPERVMRIARSFAQVVSRLVDVQREFVEVLPAPAIEPGATGVD